LRVIHHEDRLGVAAARNSGIDAAEGEWVAFLDDDDRWSPTKLECQLEVARSKDAAFAYSDVVILDERGDGKTYRLCAPEPEDLASRLLTRYMIPGGLSNVVAKTELVRSIGAFDPGLSMTADWDFLLRLARASNGAHCPGILVAIGIHAANMAIRSRWCELIHDFECFVDKNRSDGLAIDEASYARWLAVQRHRGGKTRDASLRLFLLSLRLRRPRWALEALAWLRVSPGGTRSTTYGGDLVPEPEWLAELCRASATPLLKL
jgi:glycosyltransferase involved in cell wall biosynthesis